MRSQSAGFRWGVGQRLEFIEFRLFWEGHINRSDLMDTFGVSANQASSDLNRYQAAAPDNMTYDTSAKTFVRQAGFSPLFLQPDPDFYLSQLRSVSEGFLEKGDAWVGRFPAFEVSPTPARGIDAKVLRNVIAAIRREETIEVRYQSLSRPNPRMRWIAPHALGFDGFRWHARAFCKLDGTFKDFLLSRILEVRGGRPSDCRPEDDHDWHSFFTLEVGAHPDLTKPQRDVIELDYGMEEGVVRIRVRRAFLYYALKRLGLDTDPAARKPQDQQIVLLNREALPA